jgi:hypothetical protein
MKRSERLGFLFGFLLFSIFPQIAFGTPPQSCAAKFVGVWEWSGGDATYNVTFHPDGRVTCGPCSDMTWTCNGNSFAYYFGSQKTAVMTLSADGNLMTGMNLLVTSAPQMAVRKGVFKQEQGNNSPKQFLPNPGPATKATKPVSGPFPKRPVCPKGSLPVQLEQRYGSADKVPLWWCYKAAEVAN